ncbi:hypothetical protein [Mesorhizobium sp. GbtcB19]|uniref:hypothetical protein n=1 Tax=Mesorhizobium sp. GbtcB19 TaxID=2824764 RepID=UPI001C2FA9C9|nr:hypothetical protein [Mesorhizobium sp. GbtcB19]
MNYIGDFPEDFASVTVLFTTHDGNGAPVAPSSGFEADDVKIYKNGNAAQKTTTNGLTMTSPFDSITGLHCLVIDTSNDTGDASFWVAGASYSVVLNPDTETVNSQTVLKVLATFTLAIAPVFSRVGAPAGASIAADIAAVKAVLPAALVSGRIDASVGAMAAGVLTATAIAADAITAAKIADGAIDAATFATGAINAAAIAADAITDAKVASDVTIASVTGSVGSVTGNVGGNVTGSVGSVATGGITSGSFAAGAIDNAAIATDAIGSAELAASAVTEIQSGLSTLDAAGVRAAVGLASANLDTQLGALAGYIDTEVAAIKAKTDQITFTVANHVDVNVVDWKGSAAPAMTGDAYARIGANGAGLTALGDTRMAHLDADVSSRSTYDGSDTAGTATLLGRLTNTRAGLLDHLDADISSRMATFSYTAPLDAAGTRSALGLASANLDTQIASLATSAALTAVQSHGDSAWATADVSDLPTNAELATALAGADDATLAAIASLSSGISASFTSLASYGDAHWATATGFATVDPDNAGIAAIRDVTDSLVMTGGKLWVLDDQGNPLAHAGDVVSADIKKVNGVTVQGAGTTGNEWRPA